jgi:hypothetical protein
MSLRKIIKTRFVSERGRGPEAVVFGAAKRQREMGDDPALERGAELFPDVMERAHSGGLEPLSRMRERSDIAKIGALSEMACGTVENPPLSFTELASRSVVEQLALDTPAIAAHG